MTLTGLPLQTSGFRVETGVLVNIRLVSLKFTASPESCRLLSWSCMIALVHGPVFFKPSFFATPPISFMIALDVCKFKFYHFDSFVLNQWILFSQSTGSRFSKIGEIHCKRPFSSIFTT